MAQAMTLRELREQLKAIERDEQDKGSFSFKSDGTPSPQHMQFAAEAQFRVMSAHHRQTVENSPGFNELRTFAVKEWSEELTSTTALKILTDLTRRELVKTISEGDSLLLPEVSKLLTAVAAQPLADPLCIPVHPMSHRKGAQFVGLVEYTSSDDGKVHTLPDRAQPPISLIKKAMWDIPVVLADRRAGSKILGRDDASIKRKQLVEWLTEKGHGLAAIEWALHRHCETRCLIPEPDPLAVPKYKLNGSIVGGHTFLNYALSECHLRPAELLVFGGRPTTATNRRKTA